MPEVSLDVRRVSIQPLNIAELIRRKVKADVLRLDKLHPVISGNKWFKLKYHLQEALQQGHKTLLTFGGAWSNHIIATACTAQLAGLESIGIIRGEKPGYLSKTLLAAESYGMKLKFIERNVFARKNDVEYMRGLEDEFGVVYIIPEGGGGPPGIRGSEEILNFTGEKTYSHIVCCIGSGTMYQGLLNGSKTGQVIVGIPVLKGMENMDAHYAAWPGGPSKNNRANIFHEYHFGGFARKTPLLLQFMNDFYRQTGIPTDFVYTAKLFFAFMDLLKKDYFDTGDEVLLIHSGGLQGNASLPAGSLLF